MWSCLLFRAISNCLSYLLSLLLSSLFRFRGLPDASSHSSRGAGRANTSKLKTLQQRNFSKYKLWFYSYNINKYNLYIRLPDIANTLDGVTLAIRHFVVYRLMWPYLPPYVAVFTVLCGRIYRLMWPYLPSYVAVFIVLCHWASKINCNRN